MKRLFLLMVSALLCLTTVAQADKAKYYIEGDYSIRRDANNQFVYTLSNISSKGIYFTTVDSIMGKVEEDESISFTFEKASTDCPDGFQNGLKFWKWQSDGKTNSWQRDSEVKDAQQNFETDKVMVVMLVLDCSTSLGDENFAKLQKSAIKFIDILYNASPDGSVRLGIIGFNTMSNTDKMVRNIEPLTADSKEYMIDFIHGLSLYNNTSLYYAMHKGADMISNYVSALSMTDYDKYDYACMVSFTDGYDNHSKDERIGIPDKGLDNPYFKYVRDNVVNKFIGGKPLKSYVIAVRGNDVSEDNKLYKAVFSGISSEEPVLLDDFSEVETQFENMAQELIKRWQNLTCYVPSAHKGRVRWTIGDYTESKPVVKEEPVKETVEKAKSYVQKAFVGVNGCADFEIASATSRIFYLGLGVGFDFAIPKEKAAIGGMASLKYCFGGPTNFDLGPLFVFGDYENNTSFMLGAAIDLRFATAKVGYARVNEKLERDFKCNWLNDKTGAGATLRLGVSTLVKRLYFYTDLTLGGYRAEYVSTVPEFVLDADGHQVMHDGRPEVYYDQFTKRHLYFNFALGVGYRF